MYWEGETVQCIDYNDTDSAYTHTNLREDLSTFDVTLSVTYSEIGRALYQYVFPMIRHPMVTS